MTEFQSSITADLREASSREWLETNGIGGYAMGTIGGMNTRRYHGMLVAATRPPLGRLRMLSKFEETLILDSGERHELSANRYSAKVHPEGYRYLTAFRLDPFPIWTYKVSSITLEKCVFMPHGRNAMVCSWSIIAGPKSAKLELLPLLSFVDYHSLRRESAGTGWMVEVHEGEISVRSTDVDNALFLSSNAVETESTGYWYRNFEYTCEIERGFNDSEDLYQPFMLRFDLSAPARLIASTDPIDNADAEALDVAEFERRAALVSSSKASTAYEKHLIVAADQFIVKRGGGDTIIAGYPWFSDWGRDTMIALPGLTLSVGRFDTARSILLEFSRHISQGMIPNRFPDEGETADYNTVDATLWYFEAIRAYHAVTGDDDLVRDELYEKLADILAWHLRGTRYGIRVDTDGLLCAGEAGSQLTWMDAKVGDLVISPRTGKPVEIQALWYNTLRIMQGFAERFEHKEDKRRFAAMADLARQSFNGVFWNAERNCLYDVVENGTRDASVRPNQLFAIALQYQILDEHRWEAVVDEAVRVLLTPVGLRSLSPEDPAYVGTYIGSPFDRDSAYHQGTVWAWLIGPFIDAYRRTHAGDTNLGSQIEAFLSGIELHLTDAGIGQVSEIFDGDPPHHPRGCPAQAWSVAEVLRILKSKADRLSDD